MITVVLIVVAYLIGAFPTGYLIGKLNGVDVRLQGSHNIGFTNVRRILGWGWGLLTLLIDFGKTALFLWLAVAQYTNAEHIFLVRVICGLAMIIGNVFPLWLNFRGGKAVATSVGVFMVIFPWGLLVAFVLFLVVLIVTNYLSASSLAAAVGMVIVRVVQIITTGENLFNLNSLSLNVLVLAVVLLVFIRHLDNIHRLIDKTESKFISKKQSLR